METSGNAYAADTFNHKGPAKHAGTGKIFKFMLLFFVFTSVTFLSSCIAPGPGYGGHGSYNGHESYERHEGNGGHDNGKHNGNDKHGGNRDDNDHKDFRPGM